MVFVVYNFGAIGNHFDIFCGVRLRQAPTLTFTADLEVLFMSNRAVNDEGFLLSYKRVNGKLSTH